MKKITSNLIIFLLTVSGVVGQSLPELISTAIEENYAIRIYKNSENIAENNNTAGNAGMLPSVDANGQFSTSFNNTNQQFADGTIREGTNAQVTNASANILANWTVFDGFNVQARYDQLGYLAELGQIDTRYYMEQTAADLAVVYFQLLREELLLENYNELLTISKYRLNIEEKRKSVGSGTGMDYYQALVDFQTDSIRVVGQKNTIKTLNIDINRILNAELERELDLPDTSFKANPLPNKDSLFNASIKNNKQLKQKQLQEMVAETQIRIERADRYPQIDVFAGLEYSKSVQEVGFVNSNRNFGPTVGVAVSFNLYNGGNINREIKNAEIARESTELDKKQVKLEVDAQLLNYYYQYKSVQQRISLAESNLESAKKVYRIADEQLKRGAINGYDFRLTQLTLLTAANTLLELEYALKVLEVNMYRLSGTVLEAYM